MEKLNLASLGELRKTSKPYQIKANCIFCDDDKFRLSIHLGRRIYYCFKCKAKGRLENLKPTPEVFKDKVDLFLKGKPKEMIELFDLPYEAKLIVKENGAPYRYLIKRGYKPSEIERYDLMYCSTGKFEDRIIIPIYEEEFLKYFIGRTYTNRVPKYLNAEGGKGDTLFRTFRGAENHVAIVEGVFDAMKVGRVLPAIATLGKNVTEAQLRKIAKLAKRVTLILDSDAKLTSLELSRQLGYYMRVDIKMLEGKKDPGDMTTGEIKQLLKIKRKVIV